MSSSVDNADRIEQIDHDNHLTLWAGSRNNKVCSEKKFTHICMYYANSGRASVKSLRSAKSRHPEDSKLVRQVLIIQKILPENVIEQKKFFCENTIFVKKY